MSTLRVMAKLRKIAGVSQIELAELIGRSQPDISNWERGLEIPRELRPALFDILMQRVSPDNFSDPKLFYKLKPESLSQEWEDFLLQPT